MYENIIFNLVFFSQVLLISFFLPRQVLSRVRHVVKNYPPEQYPRLYPVSLKHSRRARRAYQYANFAVLAIGLALVGAGFYAPIGDLLGWDTDNVVFAYFMLQFSPLIIATTSGFTYFNLQRKPDSRRRRTAQLRPRRVTDFLSPALLWAVAVVYVAFTIFVIYVSTFDFPWFGGYLNVVAITAMNVFFAILVARTLYGKKKDPYQAPEDRDRVIEINAQALAVISIAATLFVMLSITLSAFDMRDLAPLAQSLYFQIIAAASFRGFRIDEVNFEVYREDPAAC